MKKIMIVEDEPTSLALLSTLLRFEGFETVVPVEISEKGIFSTLDSEHPDLVLMDVNLKRVNGLEILKIIRANSETTNINVVITSGEDWSYECKKLGANYFLMKPYMPDELIQAINRFLD